MLFKNLLACKDILNNFEIIPQTMPPYPWHQGGRAYHNLLRSVESILRLNEETDLRICLDFSHTFMNCHYSKTSFEQAIEELIPITSHMHISDSSSSSNEGLNINEGSINFERIFKITNIYNNKHNKLSFIPEIWQGHFNDGEGFRVALKRIGNYIKEEKNTRESSVQKK